MIESISPDKRHRIFPSRPKLWRRLWSIRLGPSCCLCLVKVLHIFTSRQSASAPTFPWMSPFFTKSKFLSHLLHLFTYCTEGHLTSDTSIFPDSLSKHKNTTSTEEDVFVWLRWQIIRCGGHYIIHHHKKRVGNPDVNPDAALPLLPIRVNKNPCPLRGHLAQELRLMANGRVVLVFFSSAFPLLLK